MGMLMYHLAGKKALWHKDVKQAVCGPLREHIACLEVCFLIGSER